MGLDPNHPVGTYRSSYSLTTTIYRLPVVNRINRKKNNIYEKVFNLDEMPIRKLENDSVLSKASYK